MREAVSVLELERVKQLGDKALIERLTRSVQHDRQVSVELLIELNEVQERGLFRDLGFATMFDYATRRLGMSESEAALRLRAAKLARAFPIALEMLARCEIHLSTLGILASVLTPDNIQLLYEVRFKTKQQVQELVAKYAPKPDVPDSIRRMPRLSAGARPSATAAQRQNARSTPQAPLFASTAARARATAAEHAPPAAIAAVRATAAEHAPPAAIAAVRATTPEHAPPAAIAAVRATTPEQVPPAPSTAPHTTAAEQVPPVASIAPHAATTEPVPPAPSIPPHTTAAEQVPPAVSTDARAAATEQVPPAASTDARATPPLLPVHARPRPAAELVPLSPDRHKITFTASQRVRDMLEEARELRRHRDPAGQLEPLFERALELLIADEKKRRFGQTAKPRQPRQPRQAASPKPHSRYIPHEVRRQVWRRDGGQCCFCAPDGMRCGARSRLEFHHKIPFERGGSTTTDNLELMCASHNALLAERDYGRSFILHMRRARAQARATRERDSARDSERPRVETAPPAVRRPWDIGACERIQHPGEIETQINFRSNWLQPLTDEQSSWQSDEQQRGGR